MKFNNFRVTDDDGEVIPGNGNAGHESTLDKLTGEERATLLEHLKTL